MEKQQRKQHVILSSTSLGLQAIQKENQRKKDLENKIIERQTIDLLNLGVGHKEISEVLRIPIIHIASIEKHDQDKTKFMLTGRYPDQAGYVCITPGLPTSR